MLIPYGKRHRVSDNSETCIAVTIQSNDQLLFPVVLAKISGRLQYRGRL
jgi:hypothetical protein